MRECVRLRVCVCVRECVRVNVLPPALALFPLTPPSLSSPAYLRLDSPLKAPAGRVLRSLPPRLRDLRGPREEGQVSHHMARMSRRVPVCMRILVCWARTVPTPPYRTAQAHTLSLIHTHTQISSCRICIRVPCV